MIYHLVGHKILNKTVYYFKRYYFQILRYLRKCMKKFNIIEGFKILLHKLCHEYANRIYKTAMPHIMIDVIWFIRRSIAARRCACSLFVQKIRINRVHYMYESSFRVISVSQFDNNKPAQIDKNLRWNVILIILT